MDFCHDFCLRPRIISTPFFFSLSFFARILLPLSHTSVPPPPSPTLLCFDFISEKSNLQIEDSATRVSCAMFRDQPIVNLSREPSPPKVTTVHNDMGSSAGLFTPNVRSKGLLFVVVSSFAGLSRSHSTSFDLFSSSAD